MSKLWYLPLTFLVACQSSPKLQLPGSLPNPVQALPQALPQAPASSDHVAWSLFPLSLSGGLAILAGIIAMIVYPGRTGKRALILGILISLVPPLFLALEASLLVPVSLATVVIGGYAYFLLGSLLGAKTKRRRRVMSFMSGAAVGMVVGFVLGLVHKSRVLKKLGK